MLAPETAAAEADCLAPLSIHLFGSFEVRLHGRPLPRLRSRKGQWLLALLTLRRGGEVDRAWLAGTLWPDSAEEAAYASLRNSLKDLRRALGPEAARLRSPTSRTLSLDLAGAEADMISFDEALAQGDEPALERAVALYRGPLIEECSEEWALPERQAREQACLTALETLAAAALSRSDPATAERHLRRAVALDPLRESAQRALMQALAAGGNYAAATQVYRELRLQLHRELNTVPDPETQALYQQLRAQAQGKTDGAKGRAGDGENLTRPVAPSLPAGTVTFLFTDIEGSSQLWERSPEAMKIALAHHDALLRQAIQAHGGLVFKTVGDAFYAAFATAPAALAAALAAQQALLAEAWEETGPLRVRMALHTGIAEEREGDYFGPTLNRVARLLEASHGGQVLLSLPTEELVRDALPEGASLRPLGEHRLKDLVRPEQVFQLLHPDLPTEFPPLRSLEAFAHNLPVQLTSFIGREREIAEVKRLLESTRLLTLTGAGGTGKTRLALQVAADLLPEYPEGVWLVELAPLSDPALVPQTVASTLGIREEPGRPLTQTLVAALKSRRLLLLLDNCEHLLTACAALADALLRGCPGVQILATSREGLNIAGEATYRLRSLSIPDLRHLPPTLESLTDYEAVRLFIDRATMVASGFAVTMTNAPAVAQICHRLDGMPLAIELAAARTKALPVEKINERLDDRFRLLTGGSRTALPRQQTLRALIDWSYDLLSEAERALLSRLSVFAGGWTLEAAEAVCAEAGIEDWELLDRLTSLVDKSLVVYEEQRGEARYRLLETVRQYARDRLQESGEAEAMRDRHREHFLQLIEQAAPELRGPEQVAWLDRLEAEHDNLRAALNWCQEAETAARMALALMEFWVVRGYRMEGWDALRQILEQGGEIPAALRARAMSAAGFLAMDVGESRPARALLEESLARQRRLEDRAGLASTLYGLGILEWQQGHLQTSLACLEESLEIRREGEDRFDSAASLQQLGNVRSLLGEYAEARAMLEESLTLWREVGNKHGIARVLLNLGLLALREGDDASARALSEASLTRYREVGDKGGVALALRNLAAIAMLQEEYPRAAALCEEGAALFRKTGERRWLAGMLVRWGRALLAQDEMARAESLIRESLEILRGIEDPRTTSLALSFQAQLLARQGQSQRAARLFGAAEGSWEATGAPLPPVERAEHDRSVAAVRTTLDEEAYTTAWAEGRAMTREHAVAYALDAGRT